MANFVIETTPEEHEKVLNAIRQVGENTVPVKHIASLAGLSPSRTRYVILDLEEAGKIKRIPTKAFNKHYIRYAYKIM